MLTRVIPLKIAREKKWKWNYNCTVSSMPNKQFCMKSLLIFSQSECFFTEHLKVRTHLTKRPKIQIFQNFWHFWPQFRQVFQVLTKGPIFWKLGHVINPLTPGTFCKKCIFWTFWSFLGWISAKLPLIWSKMHLQHNSLPFLPPASRFSALWLSYSLDKISLDLGVAVNFIPGVILPNVLS